MKATISSISLALITGCLLLAPCSSLGEGFIDTVVASVDNQPITLSDIGSRMTPPKVLGLKEASLDPEARFVLDQIINDQLIEQEAKSRHIEVSDKDIENYLDEISKRNNMSKEGFINALADEKLTLEQYKQRIHNDILKSRIASSIARDGAGVSEEEVASYIRENPQFSDSGSKIKISQIFIAFNPQSGTRTKDEALKIAAEVEQKIRDGENFKELAAKFSDGAEAQEGGELGVMSEKDLNQEILDAVLLLKEGESSPAVESEQGFKIFKVDQRFGSTDAEDQDNDRLKSEIRSILEKQKIESKMSSYFTVDLLKKHVVDKKI